MRIKIRKKPELEEWRTVVQNDNYEVSSFGRIRRAKTSTGGQKHGLINTHSDKRYKYLYVDLWRNCKSRRYTIHVLVARAFLGPKPAGQEVRHLDGCRTNPLLSNLCYGTRSDNMQDAIRHGTYRGMAKGYKHTEEAKRKIGLHSHLFPRRKKKCALN